MKNPFLVIFLLLALIQKARTQTEIGLEVGHHLTDYLGHNQLISYTNFGLKAGFFLETELSPIINIRTSLFYNMRFNDVNSNSIWQDYKNSHCFSLPIHSIFKAGKIVHFGLGIDPMILLPGLVEKTQFHFGLCAEMTFRIRKKMRLSFYCNFDLIPIEFKNLPKSNNFILGVSFAVTLKLKKRNVIYSPG